MIEEKIVTSGKRLTKEGSQLDYAHLTLMKILSWVNVSSKESNQASKIFQ